MARQGHINRGLLYGFGESATRYHLVNGGGIGVARGRVSGWEGAMVQAEAELRFEVGSLQGGQVSALGFSYDCLSERVFGIGFDSSMVATGCCKCARSYPHSTFVPHQSVLVTGATD